VFDRQYSPFYFHLRGADLVPAESVYAAFEAKAAINAKQVGYAQEKVSSVRALYPHEPSDPTRGRYLPAGKHWRNILGGILTLESDWTPPLGKPSHRRLSVAPADRLDLGCVAAHGGFVWKDDGTFTIVPGGKPAPPSS